MGFYNQDEEPALTAASAVDSDTMVVADVSVDGTIKTVTMQGMREIANRGITDATSATLTVTAATHAGHTITLNRAAGVTVTLPAATGTGNKYTFYTGTTVTSNDNIIQVASASDVVQGAAWVAQDGGDTSVAFETASTSDTVTMNGTTKGGIKGDKIEIIDVASGEFSIQCFLTATGTEVTPFSAAVS